MSAIQNVISEKKAERRRHLAAAEVLTKQINDLEKEVKVKTVAKASKPATVRKSTKPARKGAKKPS